MKNRTLHLNFSVQLKLLSVAARTKFKTALIPSMSQFPIKNKVVPMSAVNSGILEPFNCKGLFTTTHATKNRLPIKSFKKTAGEQWVIRTSSSMNVDKWLRLPNRNSGSGLIGIGLAPSLRTLFRTSSANFFNKVVPRSAVNPDHLEPFNCKGLFTTTHAIINHSSEHSLDMPPFEHRTIRSNLSMRKDRLNRYPDRNSGSGLIGVGQALGLRTFFYENYL